MVMNGSQPHQGPIVVSGLSKAFGDVTAVDNLSFTARPGSVTGFLGPNGAGKTTTLRTLLGLVAPDSGTATIGGRAYHELSHPSSVVGAVLEATGFHPGRSGRDHLRVYCTVNGYPATRADEVLAQVGLADAARRAVRGYSLGMRQRLSLATALLGDPEVLVLDEPANGLDPGGIAWMRQFLRELAGQGRTILVSSHILSEVKQLVDHVVIINKGRLLHEGPLTGLAAVGGQAVLAHTPQTAELASALRRSGVEPNRIEQPAPGVVRVSGMDTRQVGRLAFGAGIELHELTTERSDLEQVFFALTAGAQPTDVQAATGAAAGHTATQSSGE